MSSGLQVVKNAEQERAGDQRTSDSGAAPPNAHNDLDSKDQRSLANRAAAAEKHERDPDSHSSKQLENQRAVTDPLEPARAHGNEPSRGAKVDAQLKAEDERLLGKKND